MYVVQARLSEECAYRQNAVRVCSQSAARGQKLTPLRTVVLIVRKQGQVGALARLPGEGRGYHAAVIRCEVGLGAGIADQAKQSVSINARMVERASGIHLPLASRVAAEDAGDRGGSLGRRPFRHLVDETTWRYLAIQHRAGSLKDLHAFQFEGVQLAGKRVEAHTVAVDAKGLGVETANLQPVEPGFYAILVGGDAGSVAQRFIDGDNAARLHFLLVDDRNRLRHLNEQSIGLGPGVRSIRDKSGVC